MAFNGWRVQLGTVDHGHEVAVPIEQIRNIDAHVILTPREGDSRVECGEARDKRRISGVRKIVANVTAAETEVEPVIIPER